MLRYNKYGFFHHIQASYIVGVWGDSKKFTSHVVKEYYEVIRELITVILLLDGYKTHEEGAHKKLVELRDLPIGMEFYFIGATVDTGEYFMCLLYF
jgi:hypothetical protein